MMRAKGSGGKRGVASHWLQSLTVTDAPPSGQTLANTSFFFNIKLTVKLSDVVLKRNANEAAPFGPNIPRNTVRLRRFKLDFTET